MLFQVKIRAPVRGRYPQHAWLDAIFKPPLEDVTRDFTWRAEDGYLYVRSPNRRPGYWQEVETYLASHSQAVLSHAICPQCAEEFASQSEVKIDRHAVKRPRV